MGVKSKIIAALNKIVGTGNMKHNPAITKFIQDQFEQLLKSPKLKELVERVSFQEQVSKDKALQAIFEQMATEATSKKGKKAAAKG